ncbi:Glycerophosphodiester phosphodiesterase [Penicillium chrysogenum]|uniref:Glycerophosphodiester phosphodiesterase n=1 Tax=Penicillium chrysogenum TaxID=5076 RepID=A0A162CN49_PENCH|nr:Glycerophosphodiester phosphodiesterase [Penicillium chrysogenum]
MRFGRDFHHHTVPEWASLYVPYDSVKCALNSAVGQSIDAKVEPDFSEVYALLDGSIQALCKFHRESCNFLTTRQAKLEIKFGRLLQAIIFSGHKEDDFHEVKIFLEVVKKLHDDFEKLQDYSRLNQEAIQRLFTKIEKLSGSKSLLYQEQKAKWARSQIDLRTQCANFISQFEDLRSSVIERSSDGSRPSTVEDLVSKFKSDDLPSLVAQYAALYRAIRTDKPSSLAHPLNALLRDPSPEQGSNTFLYELAGLAITCHSHLCFQYLLSETFSTNGVVLDHDLLNHVIIMEGELCLSYANNEFKETIQTGEKRHAGLFDIAIEYLASRKETVLSTQDTFGRLSLHYGALHGMDSICQSIMGYSHAWGLGCASRLILTPDWQGFTPFHYAVIENHVGVAKIFLETLFSEIKSGQVAQTETLLESLSDMLILAIRYKHDGIVFLLTKSSFDLHGFSLYGESALYVASQIGRSDYLSLLLEHSNAVHIDTAEKVHGWNPLFISCVEGHHTIVELLLQAGASQDVYDHHGWTAKEHAALRGHLHIAEMLKPWDTGHLTGGPADMPLKSKSAAMCRLSMSGNHVIVNLGSLRNGKHVEAVDLRGSSLDNSPHPKNLTSTDMSISVEGTSQRVKLPILSDMVNGPFVFPVINPSEARLAFKLYAVDSSCETCELIGSAAYLLESDKDCFGANRESLVRERTVPILEKNTMDIIGTIAFTFVIAKPLMGSNTPPLVKQKLSAEGLQLVGHRGLGQNTASHSQLQLGENTIESFLSAARLGASYVELTRDLTPIIYHDFSLSESGTDIPIHDLSLEQFMHASELQSPSVEPVSVLGRLNPQGLSHGLGRTRVRSRSLTKDKECETVRIQDIMKHTVDFRNKGFKPNTRGHSVQDSFTTLEELLTKLPDSISFNIEIKYPRLHEAVEAGVGPIAIDINTFIDRILAQIFRVGGGRAIILSSFSPEICILLASKQDTYPVLFITNAGKLPMSDMEMRASSLQAAVRFSKRWNLAGIVFASETLLLCPRLVGYVKRSGLICGSYGSLNNLPENANIQQIAGLQLLMVDNVALIASALGRSSTYQTMT